MNNYKNKEIKYLEKRYKIKISKEITLDEYIDIKRNIFICDLCKNNIAITNNNKKLNNKKFFNNKNIEYKYSYLRFDSNILYNDFSKDFYSIKSSAKEKIFFTNCGMSAITATLLSLEQVLKDCKIIFLDNDIYFETYDFYNKYILKNYDIENKNAKKIIYIDSICKKFDYNKYLNIINSTENVFGLIFDTTCFEPTEISSFINFVLSKNIFCILIRSHTKLDMMASEISSIGSLNFLIPNKTEQNKFNIIKNIISQVYYILGKFGSLCKPDEFPEFIFDKDFKKINKNRLNMLEKNNVNLYKEIKNLTNGKSILPNHKKFVLFIINNSVNSEEQNLIIKNKLKSFVEEKNNINYACSFGFDFIALDSYYDINEKNFVIRISMNDCIENKKLIIEIKEFLNDNF